MQIASRVSSAAASAVPSAATGPLAMSLRATRFVKVTSTRFAPNLGSQSLRSFASDAFPAASRGVSSARAYQYEAAPGGMQSAYIEEVDFTPQLANSVSIMGTVGRTPDIRNFENGKVANWSIAFNDKRDGETHWFNVEAWGDLADAVYASGIDKGQRIIVEGRLRVDSWTTRDTSEQRKSLKIVANSIKKVRQGTMMGGGAGGNNSYQRQEQQQQQWNMGQQQPKAAPAAPQSNATQQQITTTEELWMNYFENPSAWYDNRQRKATGEINPKSPDFKAREGGRDSPALWISDIKTPKWVAEELARQEGSNTQYASEQPPF